MKKHKSSSGLIMCFVINLLLNFEWLVLALILLGIHFWLNLPIYFVYISLGIWVVWALCVTLISLWANSTDEPPIRPENKNPYSVNGNKYKS